MGHIIANRAQTNVPIGILVTRDGGITGLTLIIRIYNGDDHTEFLDFNDGVFKAAGHTTPTLALTEIGTTGYYAVDGGFDLSVITVPAAAASLLVEYEITAGGESGNDWDTIQFTDDTIISSLLAHVLTDAEMAVSMSVAQSLSRLLADLQVNIATQKLEMRDSGGVIVQSWPITTTGAEPVTTNTGVQTRRGVPEL